MFWLHPTFREEFSHRLCRKITRDDGIPPGSRSIRKLVFPADVRFSFPSPLSPQSLPSPASTWGKQLFVVFVITAAVTVWLTAVQQNTHGTDIAMVGRILPRRALRRGYWPQRLIMHFIASADIAVVYRRVFPGQRQPPPSVAALPLPLACSWTRRTPARSSTRDAPVRRLASSRITRARVAVEQSTRLPSPRHSHLRGAPSAAGRALHPAWGTMDHVGTRTNEAPPKVFGRLPPVGDAHWRGTSALPFLPPLLLFNRARRAVEANRGPECAPLLYSLCFQQADDNFFFFQRADDNLCARSNTIRERVQARSDVATYLLATTTQETIRPFAGKWVLAHGFKYFETNTKSHQASPLCNQKQTVLINPKTIQIEIPTQYKPSHPIISRVTFKVDCISAWSRGHSFLCKKLTSLIPMIHHHPSPKSIGKHHTSCIHTLVQWSPSEN